MVEARQREEKNEKMGSFEKDGGMTMKSNERCDSFVLEMESLLHVAHKDLNGSQKDINGSPRITLQRSLSRKGLGRGERVGAPQRQKQETQPPAATGKLGSVFAAEKSTTVPLVMTVAVDPSAADGRFRRSSSIQRRSSWLDPRRVLFFFATLSSMGTLILIYFTLSLSKANGTDEALTQ